MKRRQIEVQVKPCPCCGLDEPDVGVISAQSYGVKCHGCGLSLSMYTPDKWPKGVYKKSLSGEENIMRLHEWVVNQAVIAWNCRSAREDMATVTATVLG